MTHAVLPHMERPLLSAHLCLLLLHLGDQLQDGSPQRVVLRKALDALHHG